MPFWEQAAGAVVGTGMGLALQGINNKQQLKQQQKLTDQQVAAQKQMGIFNREQQMKLWEDTNFSAQKAQMKKAGLSPGLMYGGGPGQGGTTAAASGSVGAPTARQSNEGMGMGLMGGQAAMMAAQIELTKAETQKVKAETPNVPLTGENIKADTGLKTAQKEYVETQQGIASIEEYIKGKTQNAEVAKILQGTEASMEELRMLRNSRNIQDATVQTQIKQIKADLAGTLLKNSLTDALTTKTKRDTVGEGQTQRLMEEQIKAVWNGVQQGWDNMSISRIKQIMEQQKLDYDTEVPQAVKEILDRIYILPKLNK